MKRKKGKEKADACVLAFPLMLTKIRTCRPRKRREDAVDVGDENEENSDVDEEQTDEGGNGSDTPWMKAVKRTVCRRAFLVARNTCLQSVNSVKKRNAAVRGLRISFPFTKAVIGCLKVFVMPSGSI